MPADSDRHGQTGDVGGILFNVDRQRRRIPAEALRPDSRRIDRAQALLLHIGIIRIGVRPLDVPAERLLGQQRAKLKIAANTDAQNHRRAGIAAGLARGLCHKIDDVLLRSRRQEHFNHAHVFTAEAFWRNRDAQLVPRNNAHMQHGRRIVPRVSAADRIPNHRTTQQSVHISAAHALVHGILQRAAGEVHLLAELNKNNRHARILTDRNLKLVRSLEVFAQVAENSFGKRSGFGAAGAFQPLTQRFWQNPIGLDAKPRHSPGNQRSLHITHDRYRSFQKMLSCRKAEKKARQNLHSAAASAHPISADRCRCRFRCLGGNILPAWLRSRA